MTKTYYEILGVSREAAESEIKTAYRHLALQHHPDKSSDPAAPTIFREIVEAFEILSNEDKRKSYDTTLAAKESARTARVAREKEEEDRIQREADRRSARRNIEFDFGTQTVEPDLNTGSRAAPQFSARDIAELVKRLRILSAQQRFADCEMLARQIIQVDPRQSLPYAVLGDICRARGSLGEAMKMYSYALQMDPVNAGYLRQYEEILDRINIEEGKGHRVRVEPQEKRTFAMLAVVVITLLASIYVVLSPERPLFSELNLISTWTIGVLVMLFVSGACAGTALSLGNLLDRVDSFSNSKLPPTVMYGLISLVSFPVAVVLYGLSGMVQRAFSITTSRMMGSVTAITICLACAAAASSAGAYGPGTCFLQVLVWGGNVVYLGAMAGWVLADNLRG